MASNNSTTVDRLSALLEGFDTPQSGGSNSSAVSSSFVPQHGTADPHRFYSPPLPPPMNMSDGYEHELGYYISEGMTASDSASAALTVAAAATGMTMDAMQQQQQQHEQQPHPHPQHGWAVDGGDTYEY